MDCGCHPQKRDNSKPKVKTMRPNRLGIQKAKYQNKVSTVFSREVIRVDVCNIILELRIHIVSEKVLYSKGSAIKRKTSECCIQNK